MSQLEASVLEQIKRRIQEKGFRWTGARQAIVEVLLATPGHPTAPQIYQAVRSRYPTVGRATVYRTLDLLEKLGLVRQTVGHGAVPGYLLTYGGPHVHVVCRMCERVMEVAEFPVQQVLPALEAVTEFTVEGGVLEFYGMCKSCRTQNL